MSESDWHSYEKLWLSANVYLCRFSSTVVALDLARDCYLAIGGPTLKALAEVVQGWPDAGPESLSESEQKSAEISKSIRQLIADGILTTEQSQGKSAVPTLFDCDRAQIALIPNVARARRAHFGDVLNFLSACISTLWLLRFRSLHAAVESVANRKGVGNRRDAVDMQLVADLVAIFRRLRSFTFTGRGRCLFHALVLVSFLSRYGLHPKFVMGVMIDPWAAHSWVQMDEYVLDGTPEQVRFFTPILAI